MKLKIIKLLIFVFFSAIILVSVNLVLANDTGTTTQATNIENPLGLCKTTQGTACVLEIISTVVTAILGVVGAIAVVVIVYSGILYLVSAGSEDKIKTAKSTLTAAIIGLVIAVAAYVIVNAVVTALGG